VHSPPEPVAARIPWRQSASLSCPRRSRGPMRKPGGHPGRCRTGRPGPDETKRNAAGQVPGGERRPSWWCPRSEAGPPGTLAVAEQQAGINHPEVGRRGRSAAPDGIAKCPAQRVVVPGRVVVVVGAALPQLIAVGRPLNASILRTLAVANPSVASLPP
jgi:hypothetical protein